MIKYFIDGVPHYIADDKQVTPTEERTARKIFLSEYRKKAGLTQKQLAEKLDISESYYNQIENGERQKRMDITLISRLSKVLGISVSKLIEYEENLKEETT